MSGIGTGYDLNVSTFSPDGRVFQTDYAQKAIDNSGTVIGIKCKDGVVLGVEKTIVSKMLEKGSSRRIFPVDRHAGLAVAGIVADGRQIVNRACEESRSYKSFYGDIIPGQVLADRVASFVHVFNLYWYARPFGTSTLLAAYDDAGPQLYLIEPSGDCHKYFGTAIGKGRQGAKTEVERLKLGEMTCEQGVTEVAKILHSVHEEEKPFELEICWISDATSRVFQRVPEDVLQAAEQAAKASLEESDMED